MHTILYASEQASETCVSIAFSHFWIGPLVGLALLLLVLLRAPKGTSPYILLFPLAVGLFAGTTASLSRTTTTVYLDGTEIVHNACSAGKAEQERAPISATRSTFKLVGKSKVPVLDISWPMQPFPLQIPLDSGRYLASVQWFAPDQVGEYVKSLKAKGSNLPWGLSDPITPRQ
ncbi:hypothetical protein [Rhizobium sp. C4]|uniref:hypothetical protein n=1 Tax=Rhizobium sp. C4 TaxID=1349800 RepID=UPI001E4D1130|nr:hypothetical protein [Rhizobium sp. C4]MCD2171914.1 hypothetical protein [Rhizobium sp. C4]